MPLRRNSSAWPPCSTMRPRSMTTIRWALTTVERRCAMMRVVRLRDKRSSSCVIACSESASSADVASSKIRMVGSLRMAPAMAAEHLPQLNADACLTCRDHPSFHRPVLEDLRCWTAAAGFRSRAIAVMGQIRSRYFGEPAAMYCSVCVGMVLWRSLRRRRRRQADGQKKARLARAGGRPGGADAPPGLVQLVRKTRQPRENPVSSSILRSPARRFAPAGLFG